VLLVHELIHHALSPKLEILTHKLSLELPPERDYSKLHEILGVLEVEVLRRAKFLDEDADRALKKTLLSCEYLLKRLDFEKARALRSRILREIPEIDVLELVERHVKGI